MMWMEAARAGRFEAAATCHAYGETWATLTALPLRPAVAGNVASRVVERLRRHVAPLRLGWRDYEMAMARCADRGLRSGAIYDAVHLVAAERWGADVLLTFNVQHFVRLSVPDAGPRILAPPDPPGLDIIGSS